MPTTASSSRHCAGRFQIGEDLETGKLELFDLSKDLSEANDLSAKMPEKTKELDQTLTAFLAQVKATTVQTKIGKDERGVRR